MTTTRVSTVSKAPEGLAPSASARKPMLRGEMSPGKPEARNVYPPLLTASRSDSLKEPEMAAVDPAAETSDVPAAALDGS